MTTYIITRNCCQSGNCTTCNRKSPYGKPIRVEQARTESKEYALRVKQGWSAYQPTMFEDVTVFKGIPILREVK